jgi:hypothetical protein
LNENKIRTETIEDLNQKLENELPKLSNDINNEKNDIEEMD